MAPTAADSVYTSARDTEGRLHARLYYVHPSLGIPGYPLGEFMEWVRNDYPRAKVLSYERAHDRDALAVLVSYPTWPPVVGYDPYPTFTWSPARAVPCDEAAGRSAAEAAS